jgi:hypothetical protein
MSVCFVIAAPIIVPMVLGSWPAITAAILAGGAALGYSAVGDGNELRSVDSNTATLGREQERDWERSVQMTMSESETVADMMLRGESFSMERDGVQATFRIDGRGACQVHISGRNMSDDQLRAAGTELMDRVRQQIAYTKVMEEMESRGFQVLDQQVEGNESIRIRVKRI